jgi:hypothetical protein
LTSSSVIRLWFSIAVSIIAAAVADPLLEAASNAGWFGPGHFTDHSNLDVVPALALGAVAIALHLGLRARASYSAADAPETMLREIDRAIRTRAPVMLPAIFAQQIAALFMMETAEQIIVAGHPLGGMVWMGAPVAAGLLVHAVFCAIVFAAALSGVHQLALATLKVIRFICGLLETRNRVSIRSRRTHRPSVSALRLALRSIGERAPPSYAS